MAGWFLGGLAPVFVGIRFVPVDRTNPPAEEEVPAPPEVRAILERACYDCHSNETEWPWYSRVAPMSWLAVRDVQKGCEDLNFSTWNHLSTQDRPFRAVLRAWALTCASP